jgi:hypothetical protein
MLAISLVVGIDGEKLEIPAFEELLPEVGAIRLISTTDHERLRVPNQAIRG